MTSDELCTAYQKVREKHKLPLLESAALRVETVRDLTPQSAWERLNSLKPLEGWLQFQSQTASFMGGVLPDPKADWGNLLDAEAVDSEKRAIQLRTVSPGHLQLTIATTLQPGKGVENLLADDVRHQATAKTGHRHLCYRRYWKLDPELGAMPVFAAFQGYSHPVKEAQ